MHGVCCRLCDRGRCFLIKSPVAGEDPAQALARRDQEVWPGPRDTPPPRGKSPGCQKDGKQGQKWLNFSSHPCACVRRPDSSRCITECSKCHENHCFLIFFLERLNEVIYGSYPS